jgi:hypothetical protein
MRSADDLGERLKIADGRDEVIMGE